MPVPPLKASLSGQMPESTMPTTVPAPAFLLPPSCCQRPPALSSPRKLGEAVVSGVRSSSFSRLMTSEVFASRVACLAVSWAVTALLVTV